jgi:hypothetical protein
MPAAAALTSAAAAGRAAEAAAAGAAPPTAAPPGGRTATGRTLDTKEGFGTGSEISSPVPVTVGMAAEDSKGEAGVTADLGSATANNTADSTAIAAVAAEWVK